MESCSLPSDPLSLQLCTRVQGGVVCRAAGVPCTQSRVRSPPFPSLPWHTPVCSSPYGIFSPIPCFSGEGEARLTLLQWSSRLVWPAAWLSSVALAWVPLGMQLAAEQEWASRYREWGMQGEFLLPPHLTDILGIPIPHGGHWPPFLARHLL